MKSILFRIHSLFIAVGLIATGLSFNNLQAADEIEFNRDIRPILSQHCFACHGPDANKREAGLRLDQQQSATSVLDSGEIAITPGDLTKSTLIERIHTDDSDLLMPPAEANKPLDAEQKALLDRWVEQGALYQEHWALISPQKATPPNVEQKDRVANEIDQFILHRLQSEGLTPQDRADRRTLIRRVTLDLTGLPPTREEVKLFLEDKSPQAYERLIDRLLESDRYGEHMARYWLDVVRYADTHGMHFDNFREVWPYRDWVVRGFNTNKPFDDFIIEQLAGDLIANATLDQKIASGFNRLNVTTNEGGSIYEEIYVRNVVDRVEAFGTVFMGMTSGCAVCHDHKFDPLTMKDFYQLFAFFNSLDGRAMDGNVKDHPPVVRVPTAEQKEQVSKLEQQIAATGEKLHQPIAEVDKALAAWEMSLKDSESASSKSALKIDIWHVAGPFPVDTISRAYNRPIASEGKPFRPQQIFKYRDKNYTWSARADLLDASVNLLKSTSQEMSVVLLHRNIHASKPQKVKFLVGTHDGFRLHVNGKNVKLFQGTRPLIPYQDEFEISLKKGNNSIYLKVINHGGSSEFNFAVKGENTEAPEHLRKSILAGTERSSKQNAEIADYYRRVVSEHPRLVELRKEMHATQKKLSDVQKSVSTSLVFRELPEPRPAYILRRGEYDQPQEQVERNTPAAFPPMAKQLPRNRLGLAKWLTDPAHPLTSRVAVNRFWQQIFGTGIVRTSEDFGTQGDPPTHSALLDWLAVDFRESGWDVKKLVKMIVMSNTYQQSSRITPAALAKDPQNRLLARGARFRLDAEVLRDQALALSGLLVNQLGGSSVKPPQPGGLWKAVAFVGSDTGNFKSDSGENILRRSVYTFWKRTSPPPTMTIFDAPSREACAARRERTNTPLQALTLMNEVQFVDAARNFAERVLKEGGSDSHQQLRYAFETITVRPLIDVELKELHSLLDAQRKLFTADPEGAKKLVNTRQTKPEDKLDTVELAAWTMVINLLLNLDEVVSKN